MSVSAWMELEGLGYEAEGVPILSDVSLAVSGGEYVAVIGQNGAGKSTLIKCMAGILDGWTGRMRIEGRDVRRMKSEARARAISYVPQGGVEQNPYTVGAFMLLSRYPYYRHGNPGASDRDAVARALRQVGMESFHERRMATLSGGERQMVGIAAALAQETALILLDEPVTFLDYRHARQVHQVLADVRRERSLAVVAVLHNVHDAGHGADRFVALKQGRVVCTGAAGRLLHDVEMLEAIYEVPFVLHTDASGGKTVPLVRGD